MLAMHVELRVVQDAAIISVFETSDAAITTTFNEGLNIRVCALVGDLAHQPTTALFETKARVLIKAGHRSHKAIWGKTRWWFD